MTQVFKFQMIWSENPLTIAEVRSEHDAETFRSNPEWYEIKESINEEPAKKVGRPAKKSTPEEQ